MLIFSFLRAELKRIITVFILTNFGWKSLFRVSFGTSRETKCRNFRDCVLRGKEYKLVLFLGTFLSNKSKLGLLWGGGDKMFESCFGLFSYYNLSGVVVRGRFREVFIISLEHLGYFMKFFIVFELVANRGYPLFPR